jgi:hypothetical protein
MVSSSDSFPNSSQLCRPVRSNEFQGRQVHIQSGTVGLYCFQSSRRELYRHNLFETFVYVITKLTSLRPLEALTLDYASPPGYSPQAGVPYSLTDRANVEGEGVTTD